MKDESIIGTNPEHLKRVKKEEFIEELYHQLSLDQQQEDGYDTFKRKVYRFEKLLKATFGLEGKFDILEGEKEAQLYLYGKLLNPNDEESRELNRFFNNAVKKEGSVSLRNLDRLIDLFLEATEKIENVEKRNGIKKQAETMLKIRRINQITEGDIELLGKIEPYTSFTHLIDMYLDFMENALDGWRTEITNELYWCDLVARLVEEYPRKEGQSKKEHLSELQARVNVIVLMKNIGIHDGEEFLKELDMLEKKIETNEKQ